MEIKDIHTHILPSEPGSALVCIGCGPLPSAEGHCFSAGLHPWNVTGHDDFQFQALEQLLLLPQVLAVGECGFDTLKGPSHEFQEQAFIRQAEFSEHFGKPMILHVVRDFDSVIRLRRQLKPTQPWLIHGFRGGPDQMDQLLRNGMEVSFGLKCNTDALSRVADDRLFLETDGNCVIRDVIAMAASVRNETQEKVERLIAVNSRKFLSD